MTSYTNYYNQFFSKSILVFLTCFSISSCCNPNNFQPVDNPPPLPICEIPDKIKVAVVLGGGGAKGLAHIGVLEEFEKADIPIDLIVGCSAGSIVGALYADCPSADYVWRVMRKMKRDTVLDINVCNARYGLSQGRSLHRTLCKCLTARRFEELNIPLLVVATDLYSSELVIIGGGPIIPAVQASSAIPFVFAPIQLHDRVLVDGGVIDPVPVRAAKLMGADIIIAVDLRGLLPKTFPTNLFGVAKRSAEITLLWQSETCLNDADVIIRPDLQDYGTFDDSCHNKIYLAGRRAARAAMPQILKLLNRNASGYESLYSYSCDGDEYINEIDKEENSDPE